MPVSLPWSDKAKSPILTLLSLPGIFPLFLLVSRWLLRFTTPFLGFESKLLAFYTKLFQLEQRNLNNIVEFQSVSGKTRQQFLEQIQKSYRHQIDSTASSHQKKVINRQLNQIEQEQRTRIAYSYPYRLYLEMTRNCNLRCQICCQSLVEIPRPEIAPEIIDKVKLLIPYCELVAVYGFGESLTAPHFFDYLQQLPFSQQQTVLLTTNGILVTPENSRRILESPINMFEISLDATNEDTYEFIRGVRAWAKIVDNIRYFNKLKQEISPNKPKLRLCFVAMRKNIEQLPDFVRLAKELNAEFVDVGYMNVFREELREQSLFFHQELAIQKFTEAQQVADQLQVTLNLPRYFNHAPIEDSFKHDSNCYEPWQFVQVCCDGTVLPCWNTSRPLGDLNHHNFDEIWNNQAFQEFRQNLNSREELYRCRYCLDYRFRNIHNVNHHILVLEPEAEKTR